MDYVDSCETWQYLVTSHTKLCARHLSKDTPGELAGVLPTASRTKRSLHVSRTIHRFSIICTSLVNTCEVSFCENVLILGVQEQASRS